jgi:hypothetical protein
MRQKVTKLLELGKQQDCWFAALHTCSATWNIALQASEKEARQLEQACEKQGANSCSRELTQPQATNHTMLSIISLGGKLVPALTRGS